MADATEVRTFLIVDVRGYTLFTQERGDEAAAKLAAKFAVVAREGVEARGGSVLELRGDEALCVFGSPRQAIRAAVELQARFVEETEADPSIPLTVGIGLDAGEAVPVEGGYRGGALNLAARLCGLAGPGEVLASQEVVHLARRVEGIEYADRGDVHLKGLAEPVRVIRVAPKEGDPATRLAPFVRKPEPAPAPAPRRGRRRRLVAAGVALALIAAGVPIALVVTGGGGGPSIPQIDANNVGVVDTRSGRIEAEVPVGDHPDGIAFGAGAVWVANAGSDTVSRIDTAAPRVAETLPVQRNPVAVAFGFQAVWVVNSDSRTVTQIDPKTDTIVDTQVVGNGPVAVATGQGVVWVANGLDDTVSVINPDSGKVVDTIGVGPAPAGIAVGADVWVANSGNGTVSEIDPRSRKVIDTVIVGTGPRGIAASGNDVWVANALDGTVSRIDARTGTVASATPVGDGPRSVAPGQGDAWVANEFGGSLSHIRGAGSAPAGSIRVGSAPQSAVLVGSKLWVTATGLGPGHRGGTLRLVSNVTPDSIDPDVAYLSQTWQILTMTNDGLVGFERVGGPDGVTLVPDLAVSLPVPTDEGKTYTFQLRRRIRYSTGATVRPADVRHSIERDFLLKSPGTQYYGVIVGAGDCTSKSCDLSRGIETDDRSNTVTFHLTATDPEFLYQLALPFGDVLPSDTPDRAATTTSLPATGPYVIQSYTPKSGSAFGHMSLVRNKEFREWSPAAQPAGNPDRIVWESGVPDEQKVTMVEQGRADWTFDGVPGDRLHELKTRFADRLEIATQSSTIELVLNTRLAPFTDGRVRRALNFAVDRGKVASLAGGALPTCQVLPPNFPGYRPFCPYTVNPQPSGAWTAPDLGRARRLVAASHLAGTRVTVWTTSGIPPFAAAGRYFVGLLNQLRFRATLKSIPDPRAYFNQIGDSRRRVQASLYGWASDYPAASNFLHLLFACDSFVPNNAFNLNISEFCEPAIDAKIKHALELQVTDPPAAGEAWAAIDRAVVLEAPWVPLYNQDSVGLLSARVANYQHNPQWGLLIDQLWVK